ncbi:TonB-dependent receptor [Croceitalea rosinachiae]|uniref:Carboxypeptidase-like regulatory domain-containing protein n=1 Tax=Croceitalea rosinachiae TaxID=3075596 RepID=A0ABU3A7A1_9FLAO|nr:carboxypeptidase-like regulatory domain-containing protein [Croceitalea sp. F388]MDT0605705.1 carboxypeptidase-like regulatory domain-containing protein [Croceitalea sp. F388]
MIEKGVQFSFLLVLLNFNFLLGQSEEYRLSFKILSASTGIPINNANIFLSPCNCGGATDENGLFFIDLPKNKYSITITFIGFADESIEVELEKNTLLDIKLYEKEERLSEVIVRAKKLNENITTPQMGVLRLKNQELKKIPTALGELDVLRALTLLPGVNNAGEISNGLSVRGGSLDQNLFLFDYAPVFNPTHLFGLFSVFTPDVISSIDLYRSNIPARYGGRTTSVLDIKVKNPYVNKFKLTGGIGMVSSRFNIEAPLIEDKLMVVAGGRAGFTDFLLPIFSERLDNTEADFYDATLKLLYLPTEKDQISLTGFYTKDFYKLDLISRIENINAENNQYDFQTLNGTINWLHSFNQSITLRNIVVAGNYDADNIFPEIDIPNEIKFKSSIKYSSFISEFSNQVNDVFDYYVGIQANRYKIEPGQLDPGTGNSVLPVELDTEISNEFSGYANLNWQPLDFLTLSTGFRYTYYLLQGPFTLNDYETATGNVLNTEFFEDGEKVNEYNRIEPRLGINILLDENTSIKMSYARLNQYLQNIYNSTTPLPTSRWKAADPNILPQTSDAFGVGIYKNFHENAIEVGLEGYYRISENNLTYRPGADFFLEQFVDREVVQIPGKAYGIEFSLKKPNGKVNGWLNYTWSKSLLRTESEDLSDRINNNQWFESDFDIPHTLNATINFEGSEYNTLSFNFVGQTGRPLTVPNGTIELSDGIDVPIFLERNNSRLPLYHRLDLSWNIHFSKSKENKRWLNDWTFTVYNLYGRKNPLNRFYTQRNGSQNSDVFLDSPLGSFELYILNSPLFSLTYNFTFQ